ncbi:MAG: hypothetical protein J6A28_03070 [Clostridia bacterium]|nr:hypothetical protein [Clostridia bacterium]
MEKQKKQKLIHISLWAVLGVAILFVIVTSCIIKYKQDRLNYLADQNEQLEDILGEEEEEKQENLKIF